MKTPGSWRSAEEWKSALMTLPENSFFELLRSVFGNIKTPFNKQKLLDDLFNFLSRGEIRETIAAYIDRQDHKVIAAVALLNEPAPGDLESFFLGELSCAELQSILLNLEERLILYRFRDEKILRLALNPVLEPVLAPLIADSRCLFPFLPEPESAEKENARTEGGKKQKAPAPEKAAKISRASASDGRILAALLSLLLNEDEPFRAEGKLRKKLLDEGKKFFPGLDLELAVNILLRLEIISYDGRKFLLHEERIGDFGELSPDEREEYWTAGAYLCLDEDKSRAARNGSRDDEPDFSGGTFGLSRNRLRGTASFIHRFMKLLRAEENRKPGESGRTLPGIFFPELTLRRLWALLEREDDGTGHVWGSPLFDNRVRLSFGPFLAALEMTGLLERVKDCWKPAGHPAAEARKDSQKNPSAAEPVIVMNAAFSFILYPEISFADALALGAFCSVKIPAGTRRAAETAVCFELTRLSAVQGFDEGISSARMLELLRRLSGNRLDESLAWTLKDWENRYTGVSLHQGVVLCLAEDRRYLAEAAPVASLVRRTLAPGVYLLSPADKAEAVKALRKAGVDIVAQPPFENAGKTESAGFSRNAFPRPGSSTGAGVYLSFSSPETPASSRDEKDAAASIKQKFRALLEKMRLSNPEREELSARIERRLVLTETQLEKASLRYEKLEARGLDYVGKAVIAKQAIEAGSMLEISWPGSGGVVNRMTGFPQALEKKEGESILVLKSVSREEETGAGHGAAGDTVRIPGDTIRVPLGKISLLRRIKQSIFGD